MLPRFFWDKDYGGLYWQVDDKGRPLVDRKHHYAQAFGIYGLAEYYRATGEAASLTLAGELFRLLEEYAYDPVDQGYFEASSRAWEPVAEARLGTHDPACRKSMNTMLHILEAYTNLLRVWDDARLKAQHRKLLLTFLERVIDHRANHFRLFFDEQWRSLSANVSYGHDIEGSWLLVEAAEVQEDPELLVRTRAAAVAMAEAVYREGRDEDGSLFYEAGPGGLVDDGKAWWPQAEAMVGFYNAYQISGRTHFAEAAFSSWQYIREKMVDRTHGEWFKRLHRDGTPDHRVYKAGPWECPYHHSRACFEMLERLPQMKDN
ncbi:MAG: AGE family epimerase/isomerase [Bacillota bacterium]